MFFISKLYELLGVETPVKTPIVPGHYIYCLNLIHKSGFYWGLSSDLYWRLCNHFDGEVESTRDERESCLYNATFVYAKQFPTRAAARSAEVEAWLASGGATIEFFNDKIREWDFSGTTKDKRATLQHLIHLGWKPGQVPLGVALANPKPLLDRWEKLDKLSLVGDQTDLDLALNRWVKELDSLKPTYPSKKMMKYG